MYLTTWLSRLPFFSTSPSPSPCRTNWADDTFISSDEAVAALCNDRSSFVVRNDIMTLVPGHIRLRMTHHDASAHIPGFQELFIYLNNNQSSTRLRQRSQSPFDSCDDTIE